MASFDIKSLFTNIHLTRRLTLSLISAFLTLTDFMALRNNYNSLTY